MGGQTASHFRIGEKLGEGGIVPSTKAGTAEKLLVYTEIWR